MRCFELITVYYILSIVSNYVTDRCLVSIGLVMMIVSLFWMAAIIPAMDESQRKTLPFFAIGAMIELMGISIICNVGLSLYSKLIPNNMQGFSHAARRLVSQIAIFLGPMWGTGALEAPRIMVAVPIVLLLLCTIMYLMSFNRMDPNLGIRRVETDEVVDDTDDVRNFEP